MDSAMDNRHRARTYSSETITFEDLFGVVIPLTCLLFVLVRIPRHFFSFLSFFSVMALRSLPSGHSLYVSGMGAFAWLFYIKDKDLSLLFSSVGGPSNTPSMGHPLETLVAKREHARFWQICAIKLLSGYAYFSYWYRFTFPLRRLLYPRAIRPSEYMLQAIPWIAGTVIVSWNVVVAWKASRSIQRLQRASVGQEDGYLKLKEEDGLSAYPFPLHFSFSLTITILSSLDMKT